jgi:hypothetical protein
MASTIIQPTIVGSRALLVSNPTALNRHHLLTKQWNAIKGKKKKTEQELDEIDHLQWLMGLYFDPKLGPVLPTQNIRKSAIEGARLSKEGKLVERFVTFVEGEAALEYDGPRDLKGLWADGRFTNVAPTKRGVVCVRPMFTEWRATFSVALDTSGIDERDFLRFLAKGGNVIGVGAYRSRYGRFHTVVNGREVLSDGSIGDKFIGDA